MLLPRPTLLSAHSRGPLAEGNSRFGRPGWLENAGLAAHDRKAWGSGDIHVAPAGPDFERDRDRSRLERLHQMRSDLGRLDAIAEILQVGPALSRRKVRAARLAARFPRWYIAQNTGSRS